MSNSIPMSQLVLQGPDGLWWWQATIKKDKKEEFLNLINKNLKPKLKKDGKTIEEIVIKPEGKNDLHFILKMTGFHGMGASD